MLYDDIISHLEEDAVENELLKSLQEKDIFHIVWKKAELCLNKVFIETASSHTPALPSTSSSTKEGDLKVKLPKIELNKFSGQALKWQTFWDQFESAIYSKESLSDIDKFTYLKGFWTGSASDCISRLRLAAQNYKEAVNILKSRYANTPVIISAYM